MPNRVRSARIRRGKAKRGVRYAAAQKRGREENKEERMRRELLRSFPEDDWE